MSDDMQFVAVDDPLSRPNPPPVLYANADAPNFTVEEEEDFFVPSPTVIPNQPSATVDPAPSAVVAPISVPAPTHTIERPRSVLAHTTQRRLQHDNNNDRPPSSASSGGGSSFAPPPPGGTRISTIHHQQNVSSKSTEQPHQQQQLQNQQRAISAAADRSQIEISSYNDIISGQERAKVRASIRKTNDTISDMLRRNGQLQRELAGMRHGEHQKRTFVVDTLYPEAQKAVTEELMAARTAATTFSKSGGGPSSPSRRDGSSPSEFNQGGGGGSVISGFGGGRAATSIHTNQNSSSGIHHVGSGAGSPEELKSLQLAHEMRRAQLLASLDPIIERLREYSDRFTSNHSTSALTADALIYSTK